MQIVRETWVLVVKDKSSHPVADSSAVSLRWAGVKQLHQVKRMTGGSGNMFVSVQCSECQSDVISNQRGTRENAVFSVSFSFFLLLPSLVVSSLSLSFIIFSSLFVSV